MSNNIPSRFRELWAQSRNGVYNEEDWETLWSEIARMVIEFGGVQRDLRTIGYIIDGRALRGLQEEYRHAGADKTRV